MFPFKNNILYNQNFNIDIKDRLSFFFPLKESTD